MPTNQRGILVFLSLLLLTIFIPSFVLIFGIHNDYTASTWPFSETKFLFWIGRPVQAILLNLHVWAFRTVEDFSWGRLVSTAFTIIGFLLTYRVFKAIANRNISILASFLIWTLPPSLLYVLWLTNFVSGTLATIFTILSSLLIHISYQADSRLPPIYARATGYFLLFICFCIYPPTAYFFLVFTAWRALFSTGKEARHRITNELLIVSTLSVAYFIFLKIGVAPMMKFIFGQDGGSPIQGDYQLALSSNWSERLTVIQTYLRMSLGLWFTPFGSIPIFAVGGFLLLGIASNIVREHKSGERFYRIFCVLACFGMSTAPVVLSNTTTVETRSLFASEAILVVVLVAIGDNILKYCHIDHLRKVVSACCIAIAAALSILTVHAVATNANAELEFLKKSLAKVRNDSSTVFILMPPQMDKISNSRFVYDNFRLLATNSAPIAGIVYMILRDRRDISSEYIPLSFVTWESQVSIENLPERSLVIDMSQAGFKRAAHELTDHHNQTRQVSVSRTNGIGQINWAISAAFDRNPNLGGWESNAGLPIDVTIRHEKICLNLSGYSLRADLYEPSRMPKSWQVLGRTSEDSEFRVLDTKLNSSFWAKGEERRFALDQTLCFSSLRFHFIEVGDGDILRIWKIGLDQRLLNTRK